VRGGAHCIDFDEEAIGAGGIDHLRKRQTHLVVLTVDFEFHQISEARRHKRKRDVRERKFQTGQALIDKGEALMKLPNTERVMKRPDGTNITLQPRRTRDAIEMIRVGYQLQDQAIEDGVATRSEFEEINDYQLDDYLTAKSDSQTPGSPSGSPEPAEVSPLQRSEEGVLGPRGVG